MSSSDPAAHDVVHNAELSRFELAIDGATAIVEYRLAGNTIIMTHTEVPPQFEGKGIGSRLVRGALDYAVAQGWRVQPECPFVEKYIERHPEYHAHTRGYGAAE
jgi:uncharacterized protein